MDFMIGKRIKARRLELHITQTQIQEQTCVTSGNLSCIENGKYLPSAIALKELGRVLDCSIDWILNGEPYKSKNNVTSDILDSNISEGEKKLLNLFCEMSGEDQEELLMIAEIKAQKNKKKNNENKSLALGNNSVSQTA